MTITTRARRARKRTWCGSCSGAIQPGAVYLEGKEFPGGELGFADYAGRPVRLIECRECAERYGRNQLIAEREASR